MRHLLLILLLLFPLLAATLFHIQGANGSFREFAWEALRGPTDILDRECRVRCGAAGDDETCRPACLKSNLLYVLDKDEWNSAAERDHRERLCLFYYGMLLTCPGDLVPEFVIAWETMMNTVM